MQVLEYVNGQAAGTNSSGSGLWEAQAVLLLWLSILILIPFDLVILDSSVTDGSTAAGQAGYPPLAAKIMALCQGFLSQPGRPLAMTELTCRSIVHAYGMVIVLQDSSRVFLALQDKLQHVGPACSSLGLAQCAGLHFEQHWLST